MADPVKTVLITGASNGIGFELAHLFARDKYRLVLVARREDKLQEIATQFKSQYGVDSIVMAMDLADPQSPQGLFERLQKEGVAIDVLVNNAGFGVFGDFLTTNLAAELELLQVNVVALTHLTKLFVPAMQAAHHGRVLNLASTAAFQPGPWMAVYYASKAYVLSFSEALAEELAGSGVTVTTLCPGPTITGFQQKANMENSKLFKNLGALEASQVAKVGYEALMRGDTLAIPGHRNAFMAWSVRFAPRRFVTWLAKKVQEAAPH